MFPRRDALMRDIKKKIMRTRKKARTFLVSRVYSSDIYFLNSRQNHIYKILYFSSKQFTHSSLSLGLKKSARAPHKVDELTHRAR